MYDTSASDSSKSDADPNGSKHIGALRTIPSGREDVVNDASIDLRAKRNVMRFLQLAASVEAYQAAIEESGAVSFPVFLSTRFKIPDRLQAHFHALTLSLDSPSSTTTAYALPRIHRHLTSIGQFGPGFAAVIPKWGGLAEVAQVACRAGAVGGGVYVLNKGITDVKKVVNTDGQAEDAGRFKIQLSGEETIEGQSILGSQHDLPIQTDEKQHGSPQVSRSISIISSPLEQLFPPANEGAPPSAVAIVVFPPNTLSSEQDSAATISYPVYLTVHSSDTGECPSGQCEYLYPASIHNNPYDDSKFEYLSTLTESHVEDNLPLTV